MKIRTLPALMSVVALAALSAGCSLESEETMRSNQFAVLMHRPDIDQALARYQQMYAQIQAMLSTTFPSLGKWVESAPGITSGCSEPFETIDTARATVDDALVKSLGNVYADGGLSDQQWEHAVVAVRAIAQSYGFTTETRSVDRPRDHEIVFHDQHHTELTFGSAVNTTLLVRTGCFLTPEAKRRGSPAPVTAS